MSKKPSAIETTAVQQMTAADFENGLNTGKSQAGGTGPRLSNAPRVHPKEAGKEAFGEPTSVVPSGAPDRPILKWKKGEQIGSGNYGRVYVCLNEETGSLMAVKELKVQRHNWKELNALQMEVELMSSLQHSHIVRYLGTQAVPEEDVLYIFTDWVPGGSLASMLRKFGCLPEPVIAKYTRQILLGLDYLHKNRVIHRDIKGANVLVDDRGTIKLADFGASKRIEGLTEMDNQSLRGTPYYMAPEVIRQTGHGCPADIWSVGCTVFQMAMGQPPWKSLNFGSATALMFHIANTTSPPPIPSQLSQPLRDFLLTCMERDPQIRPTAEQLLKHAFIASDDRPASTSPTPTISTGLPVVTMPHSGSTTHLNEAGGDSQHADALNTTGDISDAMLTKDQFQKHWTGAPGSTPKPGAGPEGFRDSPGQDKRNSMTTTLSFTQANHHISIDTGKLSGGEEVSGGEDDKEESNNPSDNGQDPEMNYSLPGQSQGVRTPPKKKKSSNPSGLTLPPNECDEKTINTYLKEKMEQTMQDLLSLQSDVNPNQPPSATLPLQNTRQGGGFSDAYKRGAEYSSGTSSSPTHARDDMVLEDMVVLEEGQGGYQPKKANGFAWTSPMEDALIQTTNQYGQTSLDSRQTNKKQAEAPIRTQYTSQLNEAARQDENYRKSVESKKKDKQDKWEAELQAELDHQRTSFR